MLTLSCARLRSISKNLNRNSFNACRKLLEQSKFSSAPAVFHQSATFKSDINIDKLYPNSDPDFLKSSTLQKQFEDGKEIFSGYIPVDKLEITASKSSGPGGQNVNKVNSKVEVRFHLDSAAWIPDWIKPRLANQENGRMTKDGFLVIKSDMTRKQILNQADCMNKLRKMIYSASILPREPTVNEVELRESRIAKSKANVLREKRKRSFVKKSRSMPDF